MTRRSFLFGLPLVGALLTKAFAKPSVETRAMADDTKEECAFDEFNRIILDRIETNFDPEMREPFPASWAPCHTLADEEVFEVMGSLCANAASAAKNIMQRQFFEFPTSSIRMALMK